MSSINELKALKKQIKAMYEEATQKSNEAFASAAQEIFEKHPKLESFSWTQYTPYFNDGDECHFSARTHSPRKEFSEDVTKKEDEVINKDISRLLDIFEDDDYERMFGDHVEVTVKREGVSTSEYQHE